MKRFFIRLAWLVADVVSLSGGVWSLLVSLGKETTYTQGKFFLGLSGTFFLFCLLTTVYTLLNWHDMGKKKK